MIFEVQFHSNFTNQYKFHCKNFPYNIKCLLKRIYKCKTLFNGCIVRLIVKIIVTLLDPAFDDEAESSIQSQAHFVLIFEFLDHVQQVHLVDVVLDQGFDVHHFPVFDAR